ncbi:MAG TPA: response regulator transcription factor [Acidimicrobiales bacterium]|jgi:DNA-binding response OmpR family regulator|nr:response regulator transcription factor [Acidimicrobiales bacterium]
MGGEDTLVVIEDDHHISDLVAMYLRRDGFRVLQADDGQTGLDLVDREHPDLVIVDIGLPGDLDGFDVCRRLRQGSFSASGATARGPEPAAGAFPTPVLILSARDDEVDRVLGLELGADDYVTKPFSARELVARVHAILRRTALADAPRGPSVIELDGISIDTGRREVRLRGAVVPLATREFELLAYLADNRGLALSRRQLLNGVWGDDWYGDERTVDVHVRQLRKKLGQELPLATVWGVGYRLG